MRQTESAKVRSLLAPLTGRQLKRLEELSGVSYWTLLKIRGGSIRNPGIDTVSLFTPHIAAAKKT